MKRNYQITTEWGTVEGADADAAETRKHLVWRLDDKVEAIQCEDNFNALGVALLQRLSRYSDLTRSTRCQTGIEEGKRFDASVNAYRDLYCDLGLSMMAMTNSQKLPCGVVRLTIREDVTALAEEMLTKKEVCK